MATIKVRVGGQLRAVKQIRVMVGGSLRTVRRISMLDKGVFRVVNFAAPISISVSPSSASAASTSASMTTGQVTASPSGGLFPYSYLWEAVSWTGQKPSATAPTNARTAFAQGGLALEEQNFCTFRVTVTDSLGATAQALVNVTFYRTNFS